MIVFDLRCTAGHVFEAWFGSTADYEGQRARGLVSCPICGDEAVDKAVMAPAVPAKSNSGKAQRMMPVASGGPPAEGGGPSPAQIKAMMRALARAQGEMLKQSEHVGKRFADEARAIHFGEADVRPIYGEATPAEARSLIDDGIEVAPLPFPVIPPEAEN